MNDPNNQPSTVADNNGNLIPTNPSGITSAPATGGSPTPISVSGDTGIQSPQTPVVPPTQSPVDTHAATNMSVPSTIPTTQDIVTKDTSSTPTQGTQSDILGKVASLMQGNTSLATLQTNQEAQAGIPAMTKTVNDLNTQIQGLADQATSLQNDASAGGTIQNQEQQNATGRGITAGGLAPMTAADLRMNQIKQAGIASQSLTLKSAVYAAQGNLTLAKAAADKAAQVQFDATQQQIAYQQSLLAAIQPQLDKEQKAQAAQLSADLADRTTQVNLQIENYKTGQAAIADALKNNPNDPNAAQAASQAAQLDPKDPAYLQKVQQLVAKYASDVTQRALDIQAKQGQITLQKQQIAQGPIDLALKVAQLKIAQQQIGGGQQDPMAGLSSTQQSDLKASGFTSYNPQVQGIAQQVVTGLLAPSELSKRSTGATPYNQLLNAAQAYSKAVLGKTFSIAQAQRDYDFANNTQTQNTLNFLTSLVGLNGQGGNLDQLIQQSNARLNSSGVQNIYGDTIPSNLPGMAQQGLPPLNDAEQWAKLESGDPSMAAYYSTLTEVSDQIAKILQGGGGSGTSDAKLTQASALFQKGFTPDQISAVASSLKGLLQNRAEGMIGDNPYLSDYAQKLGTNSSTQSQTTKSGQPFDVVGAKAAGYSDADIQAYLQSH